MKDSQMNAYDQFKVNCSNKGHMTKILFVCHGNICRF